MNTQTQAAHVTVSMLMTREVVTVRPDISVDSAVEIMLDQGLSRMPVVDEAGALLGVFSKTDVVEDSHARGDTEEVDAREAGEGSHIHTAGPFVSELMSRSPVTVNDSEPLARAAELMSVYQLHALPVLSSSLKLVGIISSMDVMTWVAGLG